MGLAGSIFLSPREILAIKVKQLNFLKEKVVTYISKNNTSNFSFGLKKTVSLLIQIAIPLILITSSSAPYFVENIAWLPFAGIGVFIVIAAIKSCLDSSVFENQRKEEAFQNLEGMLDSDSSHSLYPETVADFPKGRKWPSDFVHVSSENTLEQKGFYNRISSKKLRYAAGTHTSVLEKEKYRPVVDVDTPIVLKTLAASGMSGLEGSYCEDHLKKLSTNSRFLPYPSIFPSIFSDKQEMKAYVRQVLLEGEYPQAQEAVKKWEDDLNKIQCTEEERQFLHRLDKKQARWGLDSNQYKEMRDQFLNTKDPRRKILNCRRGKTLLERNPFYCFETHLNYSVAYLKKKGISQSNPIFENSVESKDVRGIKKNRYLEIFSLLKYELILLAKLDKIYNEWEETNRFFPNYNPFEQFIKDLHDRFTLCAEENAEWYKVEGTDESFQTFVETSEEFRKFVDENQTLEGKLFCLIGLTYQTTSIIEERIKEDLLVRFSKAKIELSTTRQKIESKKNEMQSRRSVSYKTWQLIDQENAQLEKLEYGLEEIEKELKAFKEKQTFTKEEKEKIASLEEKLRSHEIKIRHFANRYTGKKKAGTAKAIKEIVTQSLPAGLRRAFFPSREKVKRPKLYFSKDGATDFFYVDGKKRYTPLGLVKIKQHATDKLLAKEDHLLSIAHRVHVLFLDSLINMLLLSLTGIFLYWYPDVTALAILTSVNGAVSMTRIAIELWMRKKENKKKQLKMQRHAAAVPRRSFPLPSKPEVKRLYETADRLNLDGIEITDGKLRAGGSCFKKGFPKKFRSPPFTVSFEYLKVLQEGSVPFLKKQYALIYKHIDALEKDIQIEEKSREELVIKRKELFKEHVQDSMSKKLKLYQEILDCGVEDKKEYRDAIVKLRIHPPLTRIAKTIENKLIQYFDNLSMEELYESLVDNYHHLCRIKNQIQKRRDKENIEPFAIKELREAAENIADEEKKKEILGKIAKIELEERDYLMFSYIGEMANQMKIKNFKELIRSLDKLARAVAEKIPKEKTIIFLHEEDKEQKAFNDLLTYSQHYSDKNDEKDPLDEKVFELLDILSDNHFLRKQLYWKFPSRFRARISG